MTTKQYFKAREQERAKRNLNPHPYAVGAMWLFGKEYLEQHGGSMDFWDSLPANKKRLAIDMVDQITKAEKDLYE